MFQNLKVRLAVIAFAILASVALLARNYMRPDENGNPSGQMVTLGLDLQGGVQYALELDEANSSLSSAQRKDAIERALKVVRLRVEELSAGTGEPVIQKVGDERINVEIAGKFDQDRVREVLQQAAFLEFQIVRPITDVQSQIAALDPVIARAFPSEAAAAPAATPATPTGGLLQSADSARRDSAAGQTPAAAQNPAASATPLTSKLAAGANGMFLVEEKNFEAVRRYLEHPAVKAALPRGVELAWSHPLAEDQPGYRSLWVLEKDAIMTGEHLEDAQAGPDQFGRPGVNFELSWSAGKRFERATGAHIGDQMAIVIDNQVYTAPSIRGQIANRGIIELGGASLDEATDLALVLRAGALPAPLKIVSEYSVGPSLGQDSINKGQIAGVVGVLVVIVLMILFYKFAGVLAVIALMGYILFILGSLAFLGAALTFPGLAGLVLSVGMAVDANVLVFERIREELDRGRSVKIAVSEGFQHALSAIVDSNLTTLITAVILYYLGTGPVRGFAVTLGTGIIASLFTAIFVTRTLFMIYLQRRSSAAQGLSI